MSKRAVVWTLIAYFGIFFGAVLLRVDYYPLTWVPMYGFRDTSPVLLVRVGNLDKRGQGFLAQQADGTIIHINSKDLNMPSPNFRRLYQERMFGEGPPQFLRERLELSSFNRWWYDSLIGPFNIPAGMYQRQVLDSINLTLKRKPGDPDFVEKIQAETGQIELTREQRRTGRFSALQRTNLFSTVTHDGVNIVAVTSNPQK
ncbi:MAG: hypothetical protein ABIQ86_16780 [Steroidobacteraceae bacterium]